MVGTRPLRLPPFWLLSYSTLAYVEQLTMALSLRTGFEQRSFATGVEYKEVRKGGSIKDEQRWRFGGGGGCMGPPSVESLYKILIVACNVDL